MTAILLHSEQMLPDSHSRTWAHGLWLMLVASLLYRRHQPLDGTELKSVMLRPGQLLYTAARGVLAINNVVGSRHEGREKAEKGAFKVDFASVNIYNATEE